MNAISRLLDLDLSETESRVISNYCSVVSAISSKLPEISHKVFFRRHLTDDNTDLELMFGKLVSQVSDHKLDQSMDIIEQIKLKESYICLTLENILNTLSPAVNVEELDSRRERKLVA